MGYFVTLRRIAVALAVALGALAAAGASNASAAMFPQCPPVGQNTGCAILITINPDGSATVQADPNPPNNGPYDGAEDTLVGIQNNANASLISINLSSATQNIFGFDNDGICNPPSWPGGPGNGAAPGCPGPQGFGPSGYEGPNNSFSNISPDEQSGTVSFTTPLQPGGSAYWGLEQSLSPADVATGTVVSTPIAPPPPPPPPPPPNPCASDKTPPTISVAGNQRLYKIGAAASIKVTASDPSGIVSTTKQRIPTRRGGQRRYFATATDACGNSATIVFNYKVIVPPKLTASGVPLRGCTFSNFAARIGLPKNTALSSVQVLIDGKSAARGSSRVLRVTVPASDLSAGKHFLTITARDRLGQSAKKTVVFRRCAAAAPFFTG